MDASGPPALKGKGETDLRLSRKVPSHGRGKRSSPPTEKRKGPYYYMKKKGTRTRRKEKAPRG